ncbi:MAG: DUF2905 domain-containing protein [Acidaminococcales bacterium]|jgi:hypothetical protein|nr:DUF2905 domain-containing protein [Acidaminococcales bacterium]
MGKTLMSIGAALLVLGALVHFGGKFFPLFHLPGDIRIQRENFSFSFPVVSCILISVVLSFVFNFLTRR